MTGMIGPMQTKEEKKENSLILVINLCIQNKVMPAACYLSLSKRQHEVNTLKPALWSLCKRNGYWLSPYIHHSEMLLLHHLYESSTAFFLFFPSPWVSLSPTLLLDGLSFMTLWASISLIRLSFLQSIFSKTFWKKHSQFYFNLLKLIITQGPHSNKVT